MTMTDIDKMDLHIRKDQNDNNNETLDSSSRESMNFDETRSHRTTLSDKLQQDFSIMYTKPIVPVSINFVDDQ